MAKSAEGEPIQFDNQPSEIRIIAMPILPGEHTGGDELTDTGLTYRELHAALNRLNPKNPPGI
jgi:hypothetical protein